MNGISEILRSKSEFSSPISDLKKKKKRITVPYALTSVQTVAEYLFIHFYIILHYFILSFYLFIFLAVVKFWLLHGVSRALLNLRGSMVSPPPPQTVVSPGVNRPLTPPPPSPHTHTHDATALLTKSAR